MLTGPEFRNIVTGVFTPVLAQQEPKYEEFRARTTWSLSNALTVVDIVGKSFTFRSGGLFVNSHRVAPLKRFRDRSWHALNAF